jgi:hypothetical protein
MKAYGSIFAAAMLVVCHPVFAQFDPTKVAVEPDFISRQFTTTSNFSAPVFAAGRENFTCYAEAVIFINALTQRHSNAKIEAAGKSPQGRPLYLIVLRSTRGFNASLPTVMLMAQQQGNEPAGGEDTLVLAKNLLEERAQILDRVNVLIMSKTNPDATELFKRESINGVDINRDHLSLRIPESQAIAAAQTIAIQRLRDLGVQVKALAAKDVAQTWDTEIYVIANEDSGSRQDARGAITAGQNAIRMLKVSNLSSSVVPSVGAFYVSLKQPLAGLVVAALEPDSQISFVANRLMSLEDNKLVRVMKSPTL